MKKNYLMLIIYMFIMGLGLFVCNQYLNTPYYSSNFSEKFLPFMFILAILVLIYSVKHKDELKLRSNHKEEYLLSALLFVPIVGFGIYSIIKGFRFDLAFFILIIDTLLIGIAEEGMYRFIILGDLIKRMNPLFSIVLSSILFSLLHLLNVLGGLSISEVIGQLGSTFVMGVFLASMYLSTKNIVFPIIFHSMWDFILLSESLDGVSFLSLFIIGTYILEILISLIVIIKITKKKEFK